MKSNGSVGIPGYFKRIETARRKIAVLVGHKFIDASSEAESLSSIFIDNVDGAVGTDIDSFMGQPAHSWTSNDGSLG